MNLKNMTKEELELLSYTDLTYMLLKETNKPLNTPTIFKEICKLLGLTDEEYSSKIGDFYTSLTTDKRFLLLESSEWDLREKHSVQLLIDEDDEEEEIEENEEDEIDDESSDESDIDLPDDTLDDVDDDIEDLSIVDEDDEENED